MGAIFAVAAPALAVAPAEAAFPGRSGRIATVYHEFDRTGFVFALRLLDRRGKVRARFSRCSRADQTEPVTGACPHDPAFSASGRQIEHSLGGRLALQDVSGGQPVVLPRLTERDGDPYPSPDGSRLVFTGRVAGKPNLFVVNADGTGLRRLTSAGGSAPAWSSKGEIAYSARGKIWRLRPGGARIYVATGARPDWSPSGKAIVYVLRGSVYRLTVSGGARRRLVHRRAASAAFSPDGRSIAFSREPIDEPGASLFTARSAGGRGTQRIAGGGEVEGSVFDFWQTPAWQPLPR
jgi:hypothetical protein